MKWNQVYSFCLSIVVLSCSSCGTRTTEHKNDTAALVNGKSVQLHVRDKGHTYTQKMPVQNGDMGNEAAKMLQRYPFLNNKLSVQFKTLNLQEAMNRLEKLLGSPIAYRVEGKEPPPVKHLQLADTRIVVILQWLAHHSQTSLSFAGDTIVFTPTDKP